MDLGRLGEGRPFAAGGGTTVVLAGPVAEMALQPAEESEKGP